MGEMLYAYRILIGKPEGERPLGRDTHRWRIILEWILGKCGGGYGPDATGSLWEQVVGSC
jgi:hypothetical protein